MYQGMFSVIYPGKVQEFLHVSADVFPFFPYHSYLYANGWIKGNSFYTRSGKFISHTRVEETAILAGLYKLQGSVDLAAAHDDVWSIAVHFESCF